MRELRFHTLQEADEELFRERTEDVDDSVFAVVLLQSVALDEPHALLRITTQPFPCHACHERVELNACALARKILAEPPSQHTTLPATDIDETVLLRELGIFEHLIEVPIASGCIVVATLYVGISPARKVASAYPPVVNTINDADYPIGNVDVNTARMLNVLYYLLKLTLFHTLLY